MRDAGETVTRICPQCGYWRTPLQFPGGAPCCDECKGTTMAEPPEPDTRPAVVRPDGIAYTHWEADRWYVEYFYLGQGTPSIKASGLRLSDAFALLCQRLHVDAVERAEQRNEPCA